ncbi:Rho-related protein racF1 [Astathelohania contejeani]|uniref:Rho-related protein racF1 n=1 Tax=Astathelohania contejeani TaxID=164912 RepID=A0ABQ7HVI0_9MICR|nr:Rho-related protein racF1 [Thelohania contejeani]
MKNIKCVLVGDEGVGKTWLIRTYISGSVPPGDVNTVFDTYQKTCEYKNEDYKLDLWDTSGHPDYYRLRKLSYLNSDVILICYAVNRVTSFRNAITRWMDEVEQYGCPVILVGTKADTRGDLEKDEDMVRSEMVHREKGKVHDTIECSAIERLNINELFEIVIKATIEEKPKTKWWWFLCGCCIRK